MCRVVQLCSIIVSTLLNQTTVVSRVPCSVRPEQINYFKLQNEPQREREMWGLGQKSQVSVESVFLIGMETSEPRPSRCYLRLQRCWVVSQPPAPPNPTPRRRQLMFLRHLPVRGRQTLVATSSCTNAPAFSHPCQKLICSNSTFRALPTQTVCEE